MNSKKDINILMVSGNFLPIIGGAEKALDKLSDELHTHNVNVEILTIGNLKLKRCEVVNDKLVHRLIVPGFGKLKIIIAMIYIFFFLIRNGNKYDILHIHGANYLAFSTVLASIFIKKKTLIKFVNSGNNYDFKVLTSMFPLIGNFMKKVIIKHTTNFIAITPQIRELLIDETIEDKKIHVIPNSTVVDKNFEIRKDSKYKNGICMATFKEQKNHLFLLECFKEANKILKHKLILMGDGVLRKEIEKEIIKLGLENDVILTGTVNNISEYISNADYYILMSKFEGLSNATLEAMSVGLPCIVSDIPSNRFIESYDNESIIIVENNDKKECVNSIIQILNNKTFSNKISNKAYENIKNNFDVKVIARKYISIYKSILIND